MNNPTLKPILPETLIRPTGFCSADTGAPSRARLVPPGQGRVAGIAGATLTFKATRDQTDGAFAVWEECVPAGGATLTHIPEREDVTLYVLDGEFALSLDGRRHDLAAGTCAFLPRGLERGLRNIGEAPGRLLVLATPGGLDELWARLSWAPAFGLTLADGAASLGAQYGVRFPSLAGGDATPARAGATSRLQPIILGPGEGATIPLGDHRVTRKTNGLDTNGQAAIGEVTVPAGSGDSPHIYRRADRAFYVLEGELLILTGNRLAQAGPGSFAFVPRDTIHAYRNQGTTPARFLSVLMPAGQEGSFPGTEGPAADGRRDGARPEGWEPAPCPAQWTA